MPTLEEYFKAAKEEADEARRAAEKVACLRAGRDTACVIYKRANDALDAAIEESAKARDRFDVAMTDLRRALIKGE